MSTSTINAPPLLRADICLRELDQRTEGGITVTLLWDEEFGRTWILVEDGLYGSDSLYPVEPQDAADAFRHPFRYVP